MPFKYPNLKYYPLNFHYDHEKILADTSQRRQQRLDRTLVGEESRQISYEDLFDSTHLPSAFRFKYANMTFNCLFAPKEAAKKLYVILSGSKLPSASYPVFKRNSWHPAFDGSVLYISDPLFSLYPDLSLGWYLGTPELDIYPVLATIIRSIARKYGADEIMTYGSSGGGYAALKLGEWLPLRSIAINPQIFLWEFDYFPEFCEKTAFKSAPDWKKRCRVNPSDQSVYFIIQNDTDAHHCQKHAYPLLKEVGIFPKYGLTGVNNLYYWQYHAIGGHNSQEDINLLPLILYMASRLSSGDEFELMHLDTMAICVSEIWATLFWKNNQVTEAKNKGNKL